MSEAGGDACGPRAKLSAFVIAYNREQIIGTCLRALAFADEIIVVDKGSTDSTPAIAAALADRVISVAWSPTVEETRAFALSQCTHEWVLFLDDDECMSVEAVRFLDAELRAPRADIYRFPLRHYIMGLHDERAYYWPESHVRCFHRGSAAFVDTVHGGINLLSDRAYAIPAEGGACIHHLSHRDVAQWIEKSNRYTSQPDRKRSQQAGTGIVRFAHERIDHWMDRTRPCEPDAYPAAVAVLRSIYDLIDRLKTWEEEAAIDGDRLFDAACAKLDGAYAVELAGLARCHAISSVTEQTGTPAAKPSAAMADTAALSRAVEALRDSVQAQRDATDAARADLEATRRRETEQRERAAEMQRWAESAAREARDFESSLGKFRAHHEAMVARYDATIARNGAERATAEAALRAAAERADAALRAAAERADAALRAAAERADAAEHRSRAMHASTSWRVTAPMRKLLTMLGRR